MLGVGVAANLALVAVRRLRKPCSQARFVRSPRAGISDGSSLPSGEAPRGYGGYPGTCCRLAMVGCGSLVDRREAERLERLAVTVSEQAAPPWAAQYLARAAPVAGVVGAIVEKVGPAIYEFYKGLYEIYLRLPTNAAACLWGLGLCFYGGKYPLSIAAIEAFRLTGGSDIAVHLVTLKETTLAVQKASTECQESENKQFLTRVLSVLDPGELSEAIGALWSGYMGVLATLKLKFARTAALAHSVGDSLRPAAAKVLGPTLLAVTPAEQHRWVGPSLNVFCKLLGLTLAWKLQRSISTFQSGLAGGLIASRSAFTMLQQFEWFGKCFGPSDGDTLVDEAVGWSLAAGGIYYQLVKGGAVPLFLAPIMWPLGILEGCLHWSVAFVGGKDVGQ